MNTIHGFDRIYGEYHISSDAIIKLLESVPMKRLLGINQFGIPDEFYHFKNYSRFEHSVGVYILLNKLGASEEEQTAGLLHDVSHTAFSHVFDWVVGSGKTENYQDEHHRDYILNTEINEILLKYDFNPQRIAYHHSYPLLDRDIPDLCADRLDYSFREMNQATAQYCVSKLAVFQEKIVFVDSASALMYARAFLSLQKNHWGEKQAVMRYRLFANALKKALEIRLITLEDFWRDDNEVTEKLKATQDSQIRSILRYLREKPLSIQSFSDTVVHKKFRYVDPEFIQKGSLIRLSSYDQNFKYELDNARKENELGIKIPNLV